MKLLNCLGGQRCLFMCIAVLGALLGACNDKSGLSCSSSRSPQPSTPQETFEQLRSWHKAGAYRAMRPYLDPPGREGVLDLLIAVDELSAANADALAGVQRVCPQADLDRYDASAIADNLDLFSRQVELIRTEEQGNTAVLVAQVSGRLPLVRMEFARDSEGRWIYSAGTPDAAVIEKIRGMTAGLRQIAFVLSNSSQLTPDQVRDEYRLRLRRLSRSTSVPASEPAEPS